MPRRRFRRVRRPLVALVALLAALGIGYGIKAADSGNSHRPPAVSSTSPVPLSASPTQVSHHPPAVSSTSPVALSALPAQATQTVRLIEHGGPFPYPRNDGAVFDNAEHRLPREAHGYYHEYTVPTPGSDTRGARRIVTGAHGEFYYTGDHYETFVRVDVSR